MVSLWAVLLVVSASLVCFASGGGLVGPGAVGSYQGASHGRRYAGSVRVSEPSVGFFVAGSSIRELNGLYARINPEDASDKVREHQIQWIYKHDYTGWSLAYVKASDAVKKASGKSTEWLLIDNDGVDRLRHDGDSILPGSGDRWSHVHRSESAEPNPWAGSKVAKAEKDDEEEYPWQVIGVGAAHMMENLRAHFRHYKHTVQNALAGTDLPKMPLSGSQATEPPADLKVSALLEDGGREVCLPEHVADLAKELENVKGNKWAQAVLHLHTASCYRWRQELDHAESLLVKVTDLFPRYKAALFEQALLLMDRAQYKVAMTAFELVLRSDKAWPDIDVWLVRANAHIKREELATEENGLGIFENHETPHCVAWRQTGGCLHTGPREPASDRSCTSYVPKGISGYCECKSEGVVDEEARAMKVGCEHPPFRCNDECKARFGHTKGWMPSDVQPAADSCRLRKDGSSPAWCSPNHYVVLGVPCDLPWPEEGVENELMKRAYKKRSLQVHPDKAGGSVRAFQRVAAAHETLSDAEKRAAFDEGAAFERKINKDGTQGPTYRDEIVKKYFPDRFDFEPFGDPHSDRKERSARKEQAAEKRRQDMLLADIKKEERRAELLAQAEAGETSTLTAQERAEAARVEAEARRAAVHGQTEAAEAKAAAAMAALEERMSQRGRQEAKEAPQRGRQETEGAPAPKRSGPYKPGPDTHKASGWGARKEL